MEDSQHLGAATAVALREGDQTGPWDDEGHGRAELVDEVADRRHPECGIQRTNLRLGR